MGAGFLEQQLLDVRATDNDPPGQWRLRRSPATTERTSRRPDAPEANTFDRYSKPLYDHDLPTKGGFDIMLSGGSGRGDRLSNGHRSARSLFCRSIDRLRGALG
ncbi:hypothetical protein Q0Z83_041190 [Actinoplanes sichuanensis]|nr:hypothetical protein Q0Z83_041190 [Actinoplanes sichuanensis]